MPADYKLMGNERVKRDWIEGDCLRLERWFNRQGEWATSEGASAGALSISAPGTRERLWYCLDLLAHGAPKYQALAQQIILKTPVDHNHFEPFAAVELLLRFPDKLTPKAAAWLRHICAAHYLNSFENRFGSSGIHNFSCMGTWFLLGAAQVLDGYTWDHPLASIPEVYSRERMQAIGLNSLNLLCYFAEHDPLTAEWNSPNYTPISLHCMAKIVELSDDPEARAKALEVEKYLWRQVLAMYHPFLDLQCGPYSRSYRFDILGYWTHQRFLTAYTAIGRDRSISEIVQLARVAGQSPDEDAAYRWAFPAWQLANKYHVPLDALDELKNRQYPHRVSAPTSWRANGFIDPKKHKWVPVQGTALPGGQADVVQVQHEKWCLGWRTAAHHGHSFAIHLQYSPQPQVRSPRDLRSVTAAVAFHMSPQEWIQDWRGERIECSNFNNEGDVRVAEEKNGLSFTARPFPGMAGLPSQELSVNSFLPVHFAEVDEITLNGEKFTGKPLVQQVKQAVLHVKDGEMAYEIEYVFPRPVEMKVYRWANFVRFSGFWYQGKKKFFTPEELKKLSARGSLRIIKAP